jgi:hypothetical protein
MNEYPLGSLVRVRVTFSVSGVPINPTAVLLKLQKGESKSTFVYGVDAGVLMLQTGTFAMDVVADPVGLYTYLWYSTGTGQAAAQNNFKVVDTIGNDN